MLAGWVWRDDRLASSFGQPVAQLCGVIGPFGQEPFGDRDALEKHGGTDQVMRLSWREREGDGPAQRIGYGMNFSRPSAARATDCLFEVPPFAPAAERCALMWVESTAVVDTTTLLPVRA